MQRYGDGDKETRKRAIVAGGKLRDQRELFDPVNAF